MQLRSERDRITPPEQAEILVAMAKCSNRLHHFQRMLLFSSEPKRNDQFYEEETIDFSVSLMLGAVREATLALSYDSTMMLGPILTWRSLSRVSFRLAA